MDFFTHIPFVKNLYVGILIDETNSKMKIGRTLFWFSDEEGYISNYNILFFGLATLLNRLLNRHYDGPKIKFINIHYDTPLSYELHPHLPKGEAYYFGGHLQFYGSLDLPYFQRLSFIEQKAHIWEQSHKALHQAAIDINNQKLQIAAKNAFQEGIEKKLNPDFQVLKTTFTYQNQSYTASIWILFQNE